MKSPIDPSVPLHAVEIDPGLRAWKCPRSGGHFIAEADYWKWLATSPEAGRPPASAGTAGEVELDPDDAAQPARLCPATGRIMIRCKVGHGLSFAIDRSPGGFWLDAGEWQALRSHGLHDELHHVFTRDWQHDRLLEASRHARITRFRERIDDDDFERIERLKGWLRTHPQRGEILAWLTDDGVDG